MNFIFFVTEALIISKDNKHYNNIIDFKYIFEHKFWLLVSLENRAGNGVIFLNEVMSVVEKFRSTALKIQKVLTFYFLMSMIIIWGGGMNYTNLSKMGINV